MLLENLSDVIGKFDDFIELAGGGDDVVRDVEGADGAGGAVDLHDCTGQLRKNLCRYYCFEEAL